MPAPASRVRVCVRIRPAVEAGQEGQGGPPCVTLMNKDSDSDSGMDGSVGGEDFARAVTLVNHKVAQADALQYRFDACYGPAAGQTDLFEREVRPMLLGGAFKGLNMSIFAYGVTGSGKTHTMQGSASEPGVIPRAMQCLIEHANSLGGSTAAAAATVAVASDASTTGSVAAGGHGGAAVAAAAAAGHAAGDEGDQVEDAEVLVSYLEVYNEKAYDLLLTRRPGEQISELSIREDAKRRIHVPDAVVKRVSSVAEFDACYESGCRNRRVAATRLNAVSSRSHAVLMVTVKIVLRSAAGEKKVRSSKVHMIDLAGSEDNRRTNNSGMRMTESTNINHSLFVLSKVVTALNEGATRVPYRDSKMTRFLQDSLGGNAKSLLIANVAPMQAGYFGTYQTLNFASKSREVVNTPKVNEEVTAAPPPEQKMPAKPRQMRRFGAKLAPKRAAGALSQSSANGPASAAIEPAPSTAPKRRAGNEMQQVRDFKRRRSDETQLSSEMRAKDARISRLERELAEMRAREQQQQQQKQQQQKMQKQSRSVAGRGAHVEAGGAATLSNADRNRDNAVQRLTQHAVSRLAKEKYSTARKIEALALTREAKDHDDNGRTVAALRAYRAALRLDPENKALQVRVRSMEAGVQAQRQQGVEHRASQVARNTEAEGESSGSEYLPSSDCDDDTEGFVPVRKIPTKPKPAAKRGARQPLKERQAENTNVVLAHAAPAKPAPKTLAGDTRDTVMDAAPQRPPSPGVAGGPVASIADLLRILNDGSLTEIMALKGIGAKKAQAILDFRNSRSFGVVDDLRSTRLAGGFGKKGLETFVANNVISKPQS